MKKEGMVIKIINDEKEQYLEVLPLVQCLEKAPLDDSTVHDCTSCSGCSSFSASLSKTIKVLNKTKAEVGIGQKVEYRLNFLALQFFIIVLLPFLTFALSFFYLYKALYTEAMCILFSFLTSFLIVGFNVIVTKRLLKKLFMPFV
ncbi:MAG: SoxR reducing system RseC family protein [Treponema sp.]